MVHRNSDSILVWLTGEGLHIVWFDGRDGNNEVYYKSSFDGGTTWEADTRLTNDPADSLQPNIALSPNWVHVVWFDRRDGNSLALSPVVTVLWSLLLFDDLPTIQQVLGGLAVLAGLIIVTRRRNS